MSHLQGKAFSTRAVHAGERLNRNNLKPVVSGIYPSVSYTFANCEELDGVLGGDQEGFVYSSRYGNPTVATLEAAVAELEGAEAAHAFSSGMAAVHMALMAAGLRSGKSVVAAADVYGATYSLLQQIFSELGAVVHFVDVEDQAAIEAAVERAKPVALLVETISNPLVKVADLPRLAEIAHAFGALFLVDNTFCSPYLCNPVEHGADMVIHSATKYIGGHGDVMGGIVATTADLRQELLALNKLIGSSMGPFEAWLALRGLKTLPLRMNRQCENALRIAQWLQTHPKIRGVNYPFLPEHPQYQVMQELSNGRGGGAVLSFELAGARRQDVYTFMERLQLIQPGTSLGDIYSLLLYPAISSHRSLSADERAAIGIRDGLVRLSTGIEDADDIQADLDQALAGVY